MKVTIELQIPTAEQIAAFHGVNTYTERFAEQLQSHCNVAVTQLMKVGKALIALPYKSEFKEEMAQKLKEIFTERGYNVIVSRYSNSYAKRINCFALVSIQL